MEIPLTDNLEATLKFGTACLRSGWYEEALRQFKHCLTLDPNNVRARYQLALTHFRRDNDFFALPEYNILARSEDPESQLAAQLLRRAFQLREGDPMNDVRQLSAKDAIDTISVFEGTVAKPHLFARLIWSDKWGGDYNLAADLSIILGPGQRFYCTMPADQAPIVLAADPAWVPVWSCSAFVFDWFAAQQLFFLRTLLYWRFGRHFYELPIYVYTKYFPAVIRETLLRRAYLGRNTAVEDEQTWLFSDMPWLADDFDED